MINCIRLTGCQGFDWNIATNTAYYHNPDKLAASKGKEAFIYETQANWAPIIAIIFGVITLILFIIVLFIAMHYHVKEGVATGKLPSSSAGKIIGS